MRVVIAPFNKMKPSTLAAVQAAGHEVFCTGREVTSFAEIVSQLPAGWKPDVFLFWSLEYNAIPLGIEDADCLTVGVVGDWNLGGQAVQQMGGAFDLLFADANGSDRLRNLGFENVHTAPLWSFDPELHRPLPHTPRDLDIVLVGNFNHDIQRERAKWLARVARLSARWRVCLTSGVQGEAYTQLMNRAKIVINRSIRGEINMRAYEAPACGALLFYERENREIRALYRDRQECVLYGEDDLEDLLEYYLTHEEERERVAEAGRQRVQSETPAEHLLQLFEKIEEVNASISNIGGGQSPRPTAVQCVSVGRRHRQGTESLPCVHSCRAQDGACSGFLNRPAPICRTSAPLSSPASAEQELRRARQWLLTPDRSFLPEAEQALLRAEKGGATASDIAKLRGYLLAQAGGFLPDAEKNACRRGALEQWRAALSAEPCSATSYLNLAYLLLEMGDHAGAERMGQEAYRLLRDSETVPFAPGDLHWPRRYGAFEAELERTEGCYRQGTGEWSSAMHSLLLWRVCELLSDLAYNRNCFGQAASLARQAVAQQSDIGATHYRLARSLRALGEFEQAIASYRRALECAPFLVEARNELAALWIDIERPSESRSILEEWRAIIGGCPVYRPLLPECERLRALACRSEQAISERQPAAPWRLLAFPNWRNREHWQAIVRAFAGRSDGSPALLMLWADPVLYPEPGLLLRELETYLTTVLCFSPSALPDITLLAQPLPPEDRWKLFHIADAVLDCGELPAEFLETFHASRLPVLSLEDLLRKAA
jgi:tetratricopeptide (TPR) repeat protein